MGLNCMIAAQRIASPLRLATLPDSSDYLDNSATFLALMREGMVRQFGAGSIKLPGRLMVARRSPQKIRLPSAARDKKPNP